MARFGCCFEQKKRQKHQQQAKAKRVRHYFGTMEKNLFMEAVLLVYAVTTHFDCITHTPSHSPFGGEACIWRQRSI